MAIFGIYWIYVKVPECIPTKKRPVNNTRAFVGRSTICQPLTWCYWEVTILGRRFTDDSPTVSRAQKSMNKRIQDEFFSNWMKPYYKPFFPVSLVKIKGRRVKPWGWSGWILLALHLHPRRARCCVFLFFSFFSRLIIDQINDRPRNAFFLERWMDLNHTLFLQGLFLLGPIFWCILFSKTD